MAKGWVLRFGISGEIPDINGCDGGPVKSPSSEEALESCIGIIGIAEAGCAPGMIGFEAGISGCMLGMSGWALGMIGWALGIIGCVLPIIGWVLGISG